MSLTVPYTVATMSLKLNNPPASYGFKNQVNRMYNCFASFKLNTLGQSTRPKFICAMNMAAGGSDDHKALKLDHVIDKARKMWESAPEPVKDFPWNRASDNFIQLIIDLILSVVKYLYVPVLAITSVSEMSYCAHERKLYIIMLPLLFGVIVAGVLKEAALKSYPSLQNADVPWHLVAIAVFFTLIKLPGPYYPYWGRILIPHFANGVLLRSLWFAILWFRRPRRSSGTTVSSSEIGSPEQHKS